MTLLGSVILPSATYGTNVFNTDYDYLRKVVSYYWKRWAGISKYAKSTLLLEHIYDNDFLGIQHSIGISRRIIALFYASGLHHYICSQTNCHYPTDTCVCFYCHQPAVTVSHVLDHLDSVTRENVNVVVEYLKYISLLSWRCQARRILILT